MFERSYILIPFEENPGYSMHGKVSLIPNDKGDLLNCNLIINPTPTKFAKSIFMREKKEGLWNSTCFEIFVKSKFSTEYVEWNFAPSGDWWFMDFSDYRKRREKIFLSPHSIEWIQKDHLEAKVSLPLQDPFPIEIGISCTLEMNSKITHWALSHDSKSPDFHNFQSFLISA